MRTVGRVRHAGARGQLTVRADSGFYAHALVVICREMDVRFSITIRQHARLRELIEAIPEEDWTPVPYWMDGGADVAETTYTPFQGEPEAAPVRPIVRRVKPTPGSQLALFASYSYVRLHHRPGRGKPWNWRPTIAATPRSRMPSETSSTASASTISPRAASPPTAHGWPSRCWPITWPAGPSRIRSGRGGGDHQDPPAALSSPWPGRLTRSARRLTLHLPQGWPWETQFTRALARLRALPIACLTAPTVA